MKRRGESAGLAARKDCEICGNFVAHYDNGRAYKHRCEPITHTRKKNEMTPDQATTKARYFQWFADILGVKSHVAEAAWDSMNAVFAWQAEGGDPVPNAVIREAITKHAPVQMIPAMVVSE